MSLTIRSYRDADFAEVEALWSTVFPNDPPHSRASMSIPVKRAMDDDLLIVAEIDSAVVGTVMAGYDGHRGWLYNLAVAPELRRGGIGSALVRAAEERLAGLGCAKINLQIRGTNAAVASFYTALGYGVEDRISMGKRTV